MADVKKMCLDIIEHVDNSGLDYNINQTPYSIHFSIRKKLSKLSSTRRGKSSPGLSGLEHTTTQNDYLRQELLSVRYEYDRLFTFYKSETEEKLKLQDELAKETELKQKLEAELEAFQKRVNLKENEVIKIKNPTVENRKLQENVENKSLELKHLKNEIESIKKDKNSVSVAFQGSKKEIKELEKNFSKEMDMLKGEICQLNEYKRRKLKEEREEKVRKRKEIKKAKQKEKNERKEKHNEPTKNSSDLSELETEKTAVLVLNVESDEILDHNKKDENENRNDPEHLDKNPAGEVTATRETGAQEDKLKTEEHEHTTEKLREEQTNSVELCEFDEGFEYDEGFIGPRLPRRMTQAEIKDLYEEMMAKF